MRKLRPVYERLKSVDALGVGHGLAFKTFHYIILARMEYALIFKKMLSEAKTRKNIRQAYRYAIAAGIEGKREKQSARNHTKISEAYERIRRESNERRTKAENAHMGAEPDSEGDFQG